MRLSLRGPDGVRVAILAAIFALLALAVLFDAADDARDERFDRIVDDLTGDNP